MERRIGHTEHGMGLFTLSEQKALVFHRAVLGLIGGHPNLIPRALAELGRLRDRKPEQAALWDRWQALLDLAPEKMADPVLADTADGGLLRANSPFTNALTNSERNAVWQRIGLMQFMGYYFEAVADLALEPSEQAAITGLDAEELAGWRLAPPQVLGQGVLDRLKQVVALHKVLVGINPDRDARRRWLRHESETLSAAPLSLLMAGQAGRVLEMLTGARQITVSADDLPRMGVH